MLIETMLSTHSRQRPLSTAGSGMRRGNGDEDAFALRRSKNLAQ
jgi:hypothetical protein